MNSYVFVTSTQIPTHDTYTLFNIPLYLGAQVTFTTSTLDLNNNVLILELPSLQSSLMPADIDCTKLRLGSTMNDFAAFDQYTLTNPATIPSTMNVSCPLGDELKILIETDPAFGTAPPGTMAAAVLYIESGNGILDTGGTEITADNVVGASVDSVIIDEEPPQLMTFTQFDLDVGSLVFSFTEPINIDQFAFDEMKLEDDFPDPSSLSIRLSPDTICTVTVNCTNSSFVSFKLTTSDLNKIKLEPGLCTATTDCVPKFNESFVTDIVGNMIIAYDPANQINFRLVEFIGDTTGPILENFDLDLSSDELTLVFDEPVSVSSFMASAIFIQESSSGGVSIQLTSASVTLDNDGTTIVISLNRDADNLKISSLASNLNNTFLYFSESAIQDLFGNNVSAILSTDAQQVRTFTNDSTPPILSSFVLDLETNQFILTFTEPVQTDILNTSSFIFSNSSTSPSIELSLSNATVAEGTANLSAIVYLDIDGDTLTAIKTDSLIGIDESNTYMSLLVEAVMDTSNNSNGEQLQFAGSVVDDTTAATLIDFGLNMEDGLLSLTFNDVIDVSSQRLRRSVSIQRGLSDNEPYELEYRYQDSDIVGGATADGTIVTVRLNVMDVIALKATLDLATFEGDSFVTIQADTFNDLRGVDIIAVTNDNAIQASTYIPDMTPPKLTSFHFDLNVGEILLTFDEPVDNTSFIFDHFLLQENQTNGSEYVALSDGTVISNDLFTEITLTPSRSDLNSIKINSNIATTVNADDVYLQLLDGAVNDTASNSINATFINDTFSAIQVTTFTPDGEPPKLESFVLDLNEGEIIVTFDEAINVTTFEANLLQLQNDATTDGSATIIPITTASITPQENGGSFTLILAVSDTNMIKLDAEIGAVGSTFMQALENVAVDTAGNIAAEQTPIEATDIIVDVTPPELDWFVLDLDSDILQLVFDEPVNVSSLLFAQFSLYSTDNINIGISIPLMGTPITSDSNEIEVMVTVSVALEIKNTPGIGIDPSNTYIYFLADSVHDIAGNLIVARPDALQASQVIEDLTGPKLDSFDLDMNTGILTLRFPEPVDPLTFDGQYITVQDNEAAIELYMLTGGNPNETNNSAIVTVLLSDDDLNALKANIFLATSANNTYLAIGSAALKDTFGNELTPIIDGQAIQVTLYTNDTSPPTVDTFDLRNAVNGIDVYLVVVFSETINASTVDPTSFKLLEAPGSNNNLQLTDGIVNETNSAEIAILISDNDLANIKSQYPLGSNISFAYISATPNAGVDMVGFGSEEVSDANATQARNITADLIPPTLDTFVLDMNDGTLSLTFKEVVVPNTFNLSLLLLQNSTSDASINQTIQDSNVRSTIANTVVVIELSDNDLNAIKVNTDLGTVESNTFISFLEGIVEDRAENMAFSIEPDMAQQAAQLIPDTTLSNLLYFDLDMDNGILTLEFDEAVDVSTLNLDQIEIQDDQSSPSVIRTLTDIAADQPPRTDANGPIVTIPLPSVDLFFIQRQTNLAIDNQTTYLVILNFAIFDMNNNRVVRIPNIDALEVRDYTPDITPPYLTGFHMDLDHARMYLTFNEAIQTVQSPPTGYINISSDLQRSDFVEISSNAGIRSGDNNNQVQINFENEEYFTIILSESCNNNISCFVSLQEGTVTDYVSLGNTGSSVTNPFMATDFTVDTNAPDLVLFEEFNLKDSYLLLQFNEPVNASTFNANQIQLQTLYTEPFSAVTLINATAEGIDEFFTIVQINLTKAEVDNIKLDGNVCSRRYNCYVSFLSGSAITDIAGNLVSTSTGDNPVMQFTLDTDRPTLEDYTLDLNTAVLTLTFNEPVAYESLNADQIGLQSSSDGTQETTTVYQLTGGISMGPNDLEVDIVLTEDDICAIKADDSLATSANDTYIYFNATVITDLAHEPLNAMPIAIGDGYPVTMYINDSTAPRLSEFQLDLNNDRVLLTFNEPIRTTSLTNFSLFTLHTGEMPTPMQTVTLSGGTRVTNNDGEKVIMVMLLEDDVTEIKLNSLLATGTSNTYLSVEAGVVDDMAGNIMKSDTYIQASSFISDETRPQLISFSLDMNTGLLNLTFDDVMVANTFNPTAFRIQSFIRSTRDIYYTLMNSNTSDDDGYTFSVQLSTVDFLGIKLVAGLARSKESSWLTMQAFGIDDVEGTDVLAITDGKALQVTNYTTDDVPPQLVSFLLDLNVGSLNLTFDDFVNQNSLIFSDLTLQNSTTRGNSFLTLSDGDVGISEDGTIVFVYLSNDDLNNLKADLNLGTTTANTYITVMDGAIEDLFNNSFYPGILDGGARMASNVTTDMTDIVLVNFDLDMNSGVLYLTFDETYSPGTFNITAITFQGSMNRTTLTDSITLVDSSDILFTSNTEIEINLSLYDLSELKASRDVATQKSSTYISVTSYLIEDYSGNPTAAIPEDVGMRVDTYTADIIRPMLSNYTVDLDSGNLLITFDEVVDPLTLNLTVWKFQDFSINPTKTYTLKFNNYDSDIPSVSLNVALSETDLNSIKGVTELVTDRSDTFVTFPDTFISDMAGNMINAESSGIQAIDFVLDETLPELLMYSLDMDRGVLLLNFSEIVNGDTLDLSAFILQNHPNSSQATESVTLEFTSIQGNRENYEIDLAREDINYIKLNTSLATEFENTYLSFSNGSVTDMLDNQIVGEDGKMVVDFIPDTTGPVIQDFILDFGLGRIELNFSEPVDVSTFQVTSYTIINDTIKEGFLNFTLSQDSVVSGDNGDIVYINIGIEDLNNIKRIRGLATVLEDTFLTVTSTGVQDMMSNPVQAITSENAIQASNLLPDTVGPRVTKFILDLDDGTLDLTFSETANTSSIMLNLFSIQDTQTNPNVQYTLTDGSFPDVNDIKITIDLSGPDLDQIKVLNVANDESDTYLFIDDNGVADAAGNLAVANTLKASNVIDDQSAPLLDAFELDMDEGVITLSFNEAVDIDTFILNELLLAEDEGDNTGIRFIPQDSVVDNPGLRDLLITLTNSELNEIKRMQLCRDNETCFLSFPQRGSANSLLSDIAGNPIADEFIGIPVSNYTPDTTSPTLTRFHTLDLNTGFIILEFNEVINVSSVNLSVLRADNWYDSDNVDDTYTLTDGGIENKNSIFVNFTITTSDLNSVKSLKGLCSTGQDCYIRFNSSLLDDMARNSIEAIDIDLDFDESHLPDTFIDDTTAPILISYDLDLDTGMFTFRFDEPVTPTTLGADALTVQNSQTNSSVSYRIISSRTDGILLDNYS